MGEMPPRNRSRAPSRSTSPTSAPTKDVRAARRRHLLPRLALGLQHRVLLGAEFNAELERGRQIEAGHPEEKEPFLPPRDAP